MISLHLNSRVDAEHGPEAQALQAGAALDVLGLRMWELEGATLDAVHARYPRLDMLTGLADFQAEARPDTRTQLLTRSPAWVERSTRNRQRQVDRADQARLRGNDIRDRVHDAHRGGHHRARP